VIRRQLFDRRVVTLGGRLDEEEANRVGVALMALDATGDESVHLQIDSGEGSVGAALTLMDIIELLGVPVRAMCMGQAIGPSVGVLAVCHHRMVSPRARLRLFEPPVELSGSARQLEQMAAAHLDRWTLFCSRLSELTGQPLERVVDDAAAGRFLTAEEAVGYGLADEVATPQARMYRLPGRPMGFGPRQSSGAGLAPAGSIFELRPGRGVQSGT
jgi:ATP-dependent Clp protease protease subunit